MRLYKISQNKELRVAISGKSGCGNTTVSTLLSEMLGVKIINFTFRQLAIEQHMTLAQVIESAKTSDWWDEQVDTRQVELARKQSCILASRLAIWMLKEADFKVYLLASDDERARRILQREGGNLEEIKAFTRMRDSEDSRRYKKIYNIDNTDTSCADYVIDTAKYTPEQIVNLIITELEKRCLIEKI
ncbi:MAG: cytidylate kinase [Treponema sp. CETP13]|nr:MAG: cytidylate kinase [Treponema sp. CETP13]